VGGMTVSTAPWALLVCDWPMPSRMTCHRRTSPLRHSGEVALELDDEIGSAKTNAVACRRAIEVG